MATPGKEEATVEIIHATFQAMRDDLTKREEELTAELQMKTEESKKKRTHEDVCDNNEDENGQKKKKACLLITAPWYTLKTLPNGALSKICSLEKHIRAVNIPTPKNLHIQYTTHNSIGVSWDIIERESQEENDAKVIYQLSTKSTDQEDEEKKYNEVPGDTGFIGGLKPSSEYEIQVRAGCCGAWGPWSEKIQAMTTQKQQATDYAGNGWKECPAFVAVGKKYTLSSEGRVATYIPAGNSYCTITGDSVLDEGGVWTWGVKVLQSKNGNGGAIWVGVAPEDIDQNGGNNYEYGWYFWCFDSSLWSGPPQKYSNYTGYGDGSSVAEGQVVGVEVNTVAKTIAFSVDGGEFKVAYDNIPVDKPLVPAVILGFGGDSVELLNKL